VRLYGEGAGKWSDAATGEHGDLLDLIALNLKLSTLGSTLEEARLFLGLPHPSLDHRTQFRARNSLELAQRMFASARPIAGTIGEVYLRRRGIPTARDLSALRFHPTCYYRAHETAPREKRPALLAAVTDLEGRITGVQRTWLDPLGGGKARIPAPRRALGHLLGNGVRFGAATNVLVAGEGIETVLSLKTVMPTIPMVAALSTSHLAALILPVTLQRLYIACDADAAGWCAFERLANRARVQAIDVRPLRPDLADFNDDLRVLGAAALLEALRAQITSDDRARFAA
jgi:Toprim domain